MCLPVDTPDDPRLYLVPQEPGAALGVKWDRISNCLVTVMFGKRKKTALALDLRMGDSQRIGSYDMERII